MRKTFLKAHWGAIAATDFFSVEVITRSGLVRYFVLFVIVSANREFISMSWEILTGDSGLQAGARANTPAVDPGWEIKTRPI